MFRIILILAVIVLCAAAEEFRTVSFICLASDLLATTIHNMIHFYILLLEIYDEYFAIFCLLCTLHYCK